MRSEVKDNFNELFGCYLSTCIWPFQKQNLAAVHIKQCDTSRSLRILSENRGSVCGTPLRYMVAEPWGKPGANGER